MRKLLLNSALMLFFYLSSAASIVRFERIASYDSNLCSLMTGRNGTVSYNIVKISKKGNRIKADYMSSAGSDGNIESRFEKFKATHPNIVAYSSGAYMDEQGSGNFIPVGLNIDHGVVVNMNLKTQGYDALVMVQPNGGIAVNNLVNNSVLTNEGVFKIRNSDPKDKQAFINWAKKNRVTVFQTHLLVENDCSFCS